jgi:hypothetical protein
MVDAGSALCLYALFAAASVPVDADFALAYALSKSIRVPRLAFDAYVAAKMATSFPNLAAVRMGPLLDAAGEAAARAKGASVRVLRCVGVGGGRDGGDRGAADVVQGETSAEGTRGAGGAAGVSGAASGGNEGDGAGDVRKKPRSGATAKLAEEARMLTDKYGLAYMAAKNVIGPVSIAGFYALLRCGVDVQGALNAVIGTRVGGGAGKTAGLLALASWTSTLLVPAVVLGAGMLGPRLGAVAAKVVAAFRAQRGWVRQGQAGRGRGRGKGGEARNA